jgi:hypothetical protein
LFFGGGSSRATYFRRTIPMLKQSIASGIFCVALISMSALAQTEPVAPPANGTEQAPIASPNEAAPAGGPQMNETPRHVSSARMLIQHCRAAADEQNLVGRPHRRAVLACVRAKRPDVAKRMICRHKGKHMGLSGAALKSFIHKCKSGGA